ncbi:hypothetical protein ON010_g6410 [Phytophthora cinnamomi]|nr:hypothetical protein ON010_g6410 [Phytophthora cinnamomi]
MNPEIAPLSDAIGLLRELDDIEDVAIAAWLAGTYFTVEYPLVPNVRVDLTSYPDRDALNDYPFTCTQLFELSSAMLIPHVFFSGAGDRILGTEALAMLCYRLSYPGKLSRIRKQFGRSDASCSRIITDLYCFLDEQWGSILFFHDAVYTAHHEEYVQAVLKKTGGLVDAVSMRLRESPESVLQRAQAASLFKLPRRLYAGRLGLCMSFFGPLEGTRHDSTMLKESGLLVYLMDNPALQSITAVMCGDPAYGVSDRLTSPVRGVDLSRNERDFNVIMSKVRVSIEWLFGIVKLRILAAIRLLYASTSLYRAEFGSLTHDVTLFRVARATRSVLCDLFRVASFHAPVPSDAASSAQLQFQAAC